MLLQTLRPCAVGVAIAVLCAPSVAAEETPFAGAPRAAADADKRTLGRFGANLARNLVGVVSRDNLEPLALGAGLAGVGWLVVDEPARRSLRRPNWGLAVVGERAGQGRAIVPLAVGLFVASRVTPDGSFRAASYDLAQATVVNGLYTFAIKQAAGRTRPDRSNRLSLPSGHTSNAFAWAAVLERHYGARAGVPAYLAAGLIGVSRLQQDKHYASDVIAGAALGYVVGRTVVRGNGETGRASRFGLTPAVGPGGSGVGLSLSIDLKRR